MHKDDNLELMMLLSEIKPIKELKNNEKATISLVFYERLQTSCVLRICKGRDLSAVYGALKAVKHPNVGRVYDYVYTGEDTYVLEEYLDGQTVDELMQEKGPFSEREAARIILEVCNGLCTLHSQKTPIIHNDIKPANIRIRDDKSVKLFDFDISRTYKTDANQNTVLMGTEEFAAPEHYGFGQSEVRTDLYSLGATMYNMVTGNPLDKHNKMTYSGALRHIIEKCVQPDKEKRYASAAALKKALERFLQRKKRILIGWVVALLLVATAAGAFWFLTGETSEKETTTPDVPEQQVSSSKPGVSLGDMPAQKNPTPEQTAPDPTPAPTAKKVAIKAQVSGKVTQMVAMNNGSVVYIDDRNEEFHLMTSDGNDYPITFGEEIMACGLAYNSKTDALYLIAMERYGDASIHTADPSTGVVETPLYQAARSTDYSPQSFFYSDGTLFCSAFAMNVIDPNLWCALASTSFSGDVILGDTLYSHNYMEEELKAYANDGTEIAPIKAPFPIRSLAPGNNCFYLGGGKDNNSYLYKYDGTAFSEIINLNECQYFTEWDYKIFCVTEKTIWFYDEKTNTIKGIDL